MKGWEQKSKQGKALFRSGMRNIRQDVVNLLKWLGLSVSVGCTVGVVSSLFARALKTVTSLRNTYSWLFLFLPLIGLCIVFMYQKLGKTDGGANQVLSTVRSQGDVPLRSAPLIFISTVLTHLAGGSAGREGAAIQLGGSMGNQLGRWLRLDEEDRHVMVMCGMSAAFSAAFGTPMAAAVFSMEVISVGVMYYTALLPCIVAALIASKFAASFGLSPEIFDVWGIPELTLGPGLKIMAVTLGCATISVVFCILLGRMKRLYEGRIKNPYIRVVVTSIVIIAITILLQTSDYMGAGNGLIERAVDQGEADPFSFFWKMVLTVLTIWAGFRGGEIVPSFCIGATFGCMAGHLLGISPSLCGAVGMTALFCGMTNCPITSILIAFELFGMEGVSYYLLAVAVSYTFSGYYSLYREQTIVYSKYKAKYVNHRTKS